MPRPVSCGTEHIEKSPSGRMAFFNFSPQCKNQTTVINLLDFAINVVDLRQQGGAEILDQTQQKNQQKNNQSVN